MRFQLDPLQLLDRLAVLTPPPRVHRHRYHGGLAPAARLRQAGAAVLPRVEIDQRPASQVSTDDLEFGAPRQHQ